jgi:hypothetical protein
VSRLGVLATLGLSGLVLATPAAGALEARISVSPQRPAALERTTVVVNAFATLIREDGSCCRLEPYAARSYPLRVEAVSPAGKVSRVRMRHARRNEWRGVVRFAKPGRWRIDMPQFRKSLSVRVGHPLATPAPAGFGPLGSPGCGPPSPAAARQGFRTIFGTAVGDHQLWALPFLSDGASWAEDDAAVFNGLVGKGVKIVFAMTERASPFRAEGPGGAELTPAWVQGHLGPTWVGIPGHQWGSQFVFPEPGCWRIRAGPHGDVWLLIRS